MRMCVEHRPKLNIHKYCVGIFGIVLKYCSCKQHKTQIYIFTAGEVKSHHISLYTSQWHHNERDGVSNHRRLHCLLSRLFRCRSKKTSKLRVTDICAGNSPVTGEFSTQRASNAENVSIWWRRHAMSVSAHRIVSLREFIWWGFAWQIVIFWLLLQTVIICLCAQAKRVRWTLWNPRMHIYVKIKRNVGLYASCVPSVIKRR